MKTMDIVMELVKASGKSKRQIARDMDRGDNYITSMIGRGSNPRADILVRIADACRFDLVAVNRKTRDLLPVRPSDERLVPDEGVKSPQAHRARVRGILPNGELVVVEEI